MTITQTYRCSRRRFLRSSLFALAGCSFARGAVAATVKKPLPPVDLGFLREALVLQSRAEWTTILPRPWLLRCANGFDRITVHHQGTSINTSIQCNAVAHDLENVLVGHRERNYGDIGYHFVVDRAGRVWEGRSLSYEGAHVSENNPHNIGIMLLGNFEHQTPAACQTESLGTLVQLLREHYEIKQHRVYGHRDLCASVCPGKHLYPHVLEIRKKGEAT